MEALQIETDTSELFDLIRDKKLDDIKVAIARGANLSISESDYSPLILAAEVGDVSIIEVLVEAGADPNQRNSRNQVPAMYAAVRGHLEATEYLTGLPGFNVNERDDFEMNIMMYIADIGSPLQIFECLMKYSPDLSLTNSQGLTAVAIAQRRGRDEIVSFLKNGGDLGPKFCGKV